MARPQDNKAPWMKHKFSLRNELRIHSFRSKHGAKGYGILMMLFERLMDSDYCCRLLDDEIIEMLAMDFFIEPGELKDIIDSSVKMKICSIENGFLTSSIVDEEVQDLYNERGRPLFEFRQKYIQSQLLKTTPGKIAEDLRKGEERKGEERKEEEKRLEKTPITPPETPVSTLETCQGIKSPAPTPAGEKSKAPVIAVEEDELMRDHYARLAKIGYIPGKPLKKTSRANCSDSSRSNAIQPIGDIIKGGL